MSYYPTSPKNKPTAARKGGLGDVYYPISNSPSLGVDTPASMAYEVQSALKVLQKAVGNVDDFVQRKLGYSSRAELTKALFAEQIDAVALAIYNIEFKGQALIIGDQTGIGKGRVAAAMVKYGVLSSLKPIFITEKPNLFSDLYRDMKAVGAGELVPFIVNAKEGKTDVKDEDGKVVFTALEKSQQDAIIKSGKLPGGFDYVMLTYSQLNGATVSGKIAFVQRVAEDNILVMDESHNASGASNTGKTLEYVLKKSKGVTFLSATFAKRPENMPIYAAKTCMSESNLTPEGMTQSIILGGVALQEVISSQLVGQGQLIRRERNFEGIEVNYLFSEGQEAVQQRKTADQITEIIRQIIGFQADYVAPIIKYMDKVAAADGGEIERRKGTKSGGVDNTPYFSKIFNVINQLLFAVKADAVVNRTLFRLQQNKKVVIAFSSTMGAFLSSLEDKDGNPIQNGQTINADFASVLKRGLDGVMRYTKTDEMGQKGYGQLAVSDLSEEGQLEYKYIYQKIKKASTGIVISPIDFIKQRLEQQGYRVGEVTGRSLQLTLGYKNKAKLGQSTDPIYGVLENRPRENTSDAFRRFNDNEIDVLLINQSGSTGASAHAIPTKKVAASQVKQRVMIVLQAELDISTEVQKRGRINRTGQIMKPIYDYVNCSVPAEKRLMMMLQKKLKSLDANTTSNQKNSEAILKSDDFLNKYGDEVVTEYLRENPTLNRKIGDPLGLTEKEGTSQENAAHRVSGRIAILPSKEQEEFYEDITNQYQDYVKLLVERGTYNLEVETMDLKAKTIERSILIANGTGGSTPFSENTYLEKSEVAVLKKPFSVDELQKLIEDALGGMSAVAKANEIQKEAYATVFARMKQLDGQIEGRYDEAIRKVAKEKGYAKAEEKERYLQERSFQLEGEKIAEVKKNQAKYNDEYTTLKDLFSFFVIGKELNIKSEDGSSYAGVSLGFLFGKNKTNRFAPSNVSLKIAVASSSRLQTVPLSKKTIQYAYAIKGSSDSYQSNLSDTLENWRTAILAGSKNRNIRYIVTGNLLQFFGNDSVKSKGKLIQFTTIDGKSRKGALLPESYNSISNEEQITAVPIQRCEAVLKAYNQVECSLGIVFQKSRWGESWAVEVPASRQAMGHIFLDPSLLKLVEQSGFNKVGQVMRGGLTLENLRPFIAILGETHKINALLNAEQFKFVANQFEIKPINDEQNITTSSEAKLNRIVAQLLTLKPQLEAI